MSTSAGTGSRPDPDRRLREAEAALAATRAELRRVRASTSYRLGRRIVRTVRGPVEGGRRALSRTVRRGTRVTPSRWRTAVPELTRGALVAVAGGRRSAEVPAPDGTTEGLAERPDAGVLGPRTLTQGPVHLFVLVGLRPDERDRVVAEIARLREPVGGFVPVFVTDDSDFSPYRRLGLPFEYVTPAYEWAAAGELIDHPSYVDRRVQGLVAHYMPRHVFVLRDGTRDLATVRADLWPFLAPARDGAA